MIISRCPICGESLDRYRLKTVISLFRIRGGFHTHKCNTCETKFAPSTFVLLVTVLALGQINIRETDFNFVFGILVIVLVFVLLVAYLMPLSVIKKSGENQE